MGGTGGGGHISLRLARRSDVPSIQRCNLETLPENYSAAFYVNHMDDDDDDLKKKKK